MQPRLRVVLSSKVQEYLTQDNVAPSTPMESIGYFFSGQGADGISRAKKYQQEVINAADSYDDSKLLKKVWEDLKEDVAGHLGTSKQLRKRLYNGLCDYFKVSLDDVENKRCGLVADYYSRVSSAMTGTPAVPPDYMQFQAYRMALSSHVNSMLPKENLTNDNFFAL